MVLFLDW